MNQLYSHNQEYPTIRLRAFRAIDDPESCLLFIEGHLNVLKSIGVEKVTSSKNEWMHNPAAFVLVVESLDGEKIYGGARIHVAGGSEPLPIEQATSYLDKSVYDLVWHYAQEGTGEICGLWNSREIAGYGIGSIFLTRAAVAISSQIGLKSLFALCAPYTVKMAESVGYTIETSIGNKGTFYYPKLDLLATSMVLKDVEALSKAHEEDKDAILSLRENMTLVKIEELRKKKIEICYEIKIPYLNNWNLQHVITTAQRNFENKKLNENQLNIF